MITNELDNNGELQFLFAAPTGFSTSRAYNLMSSLHVLIETVFGGKCIFTPRALVWLFTSMLPLMRNQSLLCAQLFRAILTLELGFFMRSFMGSEMGQIPIAQRAMLALIFLVCGVFCSLVLYAS